MVEIGYKYLVKLGYDDHGYNDKFVELFCPEWKISYMELYDYIKKNFVGPVEFIINF